mmetsp:Transcript_58697/g.96915  ORF Transcript_58697/g.96915 Transcript_58697/m.96915 type:complete len:144 (+) Transcript_58697:113-544(+)
MPKIYYKKPVRVENTGSWQLELANNDTGYKHVSKLQAESTQAVKCFRATVKQVHLGTFETARDAAVAVAMYKKSPIEFKLIDKRQSDHRRNAVKAEMCARQYIMLRLFAAPIGAFFAGDTRAACPSLACLGGQLMLLLHGSVL